MNVIDRVVQAVDTWQRRHTASAFLFGVIKKYGEDAASYQAALITYYGFLSLFPLLLVATSVLQLVLANRPDLQQDIIRQITDYIPLIGNQLGSSISDTGRSGVALVVGLLLTLYGARGSADALQHAYNHSWHVPRPARPGFPKAPLMSLAIMFVGGIGLALAAGLSTWSAGFSDATWFKIVPSLVSIVVLIGVFLFVSNLSIAKTLSWRELLPGAVIAAVGIHVLQLFGGLILGNQMKNFTDLYGTFALVLGILAWIYLQAQVLMYAVTANTVAYYKLWPRSITGPLIKQDRQAFRLYAQKEQFSEHEAVTVTFAKQPRS